MKTAAAVEVLLCLIYYRMDDGEGRTVLVFWNISLMCVSTCGIGCL